MRIVLVAEESAGLQVLRMLAQSEHELVAALASPDRGAEQGTSVWRLAEKLGVRTLPSVNVTKPEFANTLADDGIDVILNVHALYVVCEEVLAVPRLAAFNLHPGPLPHYAGLNAPSWALYRGETRHAVTLHKMEAGIDTGAIAYQASFPIEETDTAIAVYSKCVRLGVPLIAKLLDTLDSDSRSLPVIPQDMTKRRYLSRMVPNRGRLSWSQPAKAIINFVRACDFGPFESPWGHPECALGDRKIKVVRASRTGQATSEPPGTVVDRDDRSVDVAAEDELVRVSHVEFDGKTIAAPMVLSTGQRLTNS